MKEQHGVRETGSHATFPHGPPGITCQLDEDIAY